MTPFPESSGGAEKLATDREQVLIGKPFVRTRTRV